MTEIERTMRKELNELIKNESLGKYHSLSEIPTVNRAICTIKIGVTLLLGIAVFAVILNHSPLLIVLEFFPYMETFYTFASIMEYTLLFCLLAITIHFSKKTCNDKIGIETRIIRNTYVTPTPLLMSTYRMASMQMRNSGMVCDDWEHKKLLKIGEIEEFIDQYSKY